MVFAILLLLFFSFVNISSESVNRTTEARQSTKNWFADLKLSHAQKVPSGSISSALTGVRPAWAWTYGVQVPYTWTLLIFLILAEVLVEGKS